MNLLRLLPCAVAAVAALLAPAAAEERCFNKDFMFGSATASYQVEGAYMEGGRTPSIWDDFCRQKPGLSCANVADDFYHRYPSDLKMMADDDGALPAGWLSSDIINHYVDFATLMFQEFGQKLDYWTTFNEPYSFVTQGYGTGVHAPGFTGSKTNTYIVTHNLLRAHALAVQKFREFRSTAHARLGEGQGRRRHSRSRGARLSSKDRHGNRNCGWFTAYPPGYLALIKWVSVHDPSADVLLTENGWCGNAEADGAEDQMWYYTNYMEQVYKAVTEEKIKVIGYTAWSYLDNYEWGSFEPASDCTTSTSRPRLVPRTTTGSKDYVSAKPSELERTPRPAAKWFSKLAKTKCIPTTSEAAAVSAPSGVSSSEGLSTWSIVGIAVVAVVVVGMARAYNNIAAVRAQKESTTRVISIILLRSFMKSEYGLHIS
ncbi:Glycosyl hydrolases family 1, N-terminal conserved site [Phytophthora cactorum]|nr:Glycosyl hydrolases family 1, N-terminal conserved site [Phytophthora cactorum]